MKVKIKRCMNCKILLSNSSKVCTKCGAKELEAGFYTDESNKNTLSNRHLNESNNDNSFCPICCAPISNNSQECIICDAVFYRTSEGIIYGTSYDDDINKQSLENNEK